MSVDELARALAPGIEVDEAADLVRWRDRHGGTHRTGLHDYAGLYAVPGLYEAVYYVALGGRSPQLLAGALVDAVPAGERAEVSVLDVGAGTGAVGAALAEVGFRRIAGTDLEPASEGALRRDRPGVYSAARTLDLLHLTPDDDRWLAEVAPRVVTVAGAVGFGHLPVEAFGVLTARLPEGSLLAVTAARDLDVTPELAAHGTLLLGPAYQQVVRRDGVHRRTAHGGVLEVTALVLRRTGVPA